MRKSGVFSTFLFLSIVGAGLYGILHNQITASISPEYFTRFKFTQFRIDVHMPFRTGVSLVGFYATWWTGAVTGLILGLTALIFPDYKTMRKALYRSLLAVFGITVLTGITGYIYGKYFQNTDNLSRWIPAELQDRNGFILTGTIHNFSYAGGLTGLLAGFVYLVAENKKIRKRQPAGERNFYY